MHVKCYAIQCMLRFVEIRKTKEIQQTRLIMSNTYLKVPLFASISSNASRHIGGAFTADSSISWPSFSEVIF